MATMTTTESSEFNLTWFDSKFLFFSCNSMHQHPETRNAVLQSTSLKRVVILRRKQKQTNQIAVIFHVVV